MREEQGALAADGAALGREDSGRDGAGVVILVAGRAAGGGSEKPVGVIVQLREDERGLRVIGRLSARTAVGREAAALLTAGAVDGLSFGYRVREAYEVRPRELRALDRKSGVEGKSVSVGVDIGGRRIIKQ